MRWEQEARSALATNPQVADVLQLLGGLAVALGSQPVGELPPTLWLDLERRVARMHGVQSLVPLSEALALPAPVPER